MVRKALVALSILLPVSAFADSSTTCTQSPLGTFVNCTTTERPNDTSLSDGINAMSRAIMARAPKPVPPSQAIQAPHPTPPKSYEIYDPAIYRDVCAGDFRGGLDRVGLGLCVGYVAGLARRESRLPAIQRGFCIPDEVDMDQALTIANRFAAARPEMGTMSSDLMLAAAFAAVFPCPKEIPPSK